MPKPNIYIDDKANTSAIAADKSPKRPTEMPAVKVRTYDMLTVAIKVINDFEEANNSLSVIFSVNRITAINNLLNLDVSILNISLSQTYKFFVALFKM